MLPISSSGDSSLTSVNLEITRWHVTIWAPENIDFPSVNVQSYDQVVEIQTGTWEILWVEDLRSAPEWYYTTISIADFFSSNWWNISSENFKIKADSWIVTMWWPSVSEVKISSWSINNFVSLNNPAWLIYRNEDAFTRVWKYWTMPKFQLTIPKYQTVWDYTWIMTFTLIENL